MAWLLCLGFCLSPAAAAGNTALAIRILDPSLANPSPTVVTDDSLDAHFRTFDDRGTGRPTGAFWLKLLPSKTAIPADLPALTMRVGRQTRIRIFAQADGTTPPRAHDRHDLWRVDGPGAGRAAHLADVA
ncbi:MAG: hypothetical protein KGJ55_00705 [Gammaproteobacteria bacterium]|nr:hypothetical protein [Gammaproteobacteria bacterium]